MLKVHSNKARASASVKTIDYKVQSVPISDLRPNPGNVRTHSKRQVRLVSPFGFATGATSGFRFSVHTGTLAVHQKAC
jgi:hypothetical protein